MIAYLADKAIAEMTQSLEELTPTQERAYTWIKAYIQAHGISPTYREVMKGVGYKSPAPVQSVLELLARKGRITWNRNSPRSIQLVAESVQTVIVPQGHSVVIVPPGYAAQLVPIPDFQAAS